MRNGFLVVQRLGEEIWPDLILPSYKDTTDTEANCVAKSLLIYITTEPKNFAVYVSFMYTVTFVYKVNYLYSS